MSRKVLVQAWPGGSYAATEVLMDLDAVTLVLPTPSSDDDHPHSLVTIGQQSVLVLESFAAFKQRVMEQPDTAERRGPCGECGYQSGHAGYCATGRALDNEWARKEALVRIAREKLER